MQARDVLFSRTTQRVLGTLFRAQEALPYAEIVRRTQGGSGAIYRELARFLAAGLIIEAGVPSRRLFAPNRSHPLYPELHAIAGKLAPGEADARLDPLMARTLARKYLWWEEADEARRDLRRLVAQVMNLGTFDDVRYVERRLGPDYLRSVLRKSAPGHFDARPWTYWHYRLGLAQPGRVPPLPRRRLP